MRVARVVKSRRAVSASSSGQPQHRRRDVLDGQALHLGTEGPLELRVLRLNPAHGHGHFGHDRPGLLDLALDGLDPGLTGTE